MAGGRGGAVRSSFSFSASSSSSAFSSSASSSSSSSGVVGGVRVVGARREEDRLHGGVQLAQRLLQPLPLPAELRQVSQLQGRPRGAATHDGGATWRRVQPSDGAGRRAGGRKGRHQGRRDASAAGEAHLRLRRRLGRCARRLDPRRLGHLRRLALGLGLHLLQLALQAREAELGGHALVALLLGLGPLRLKRGLHRVQLRLHPRHRARLRPALGCHRLPRVLAARVRLESDDGAVALVGKAPRGARRSVLLHRRRPPCRRLEGHGGAVARALVALGLADLAAARVSLQPHRRCPPLRQPPPRALAAGDGLHLGGASGVGGGQAALQRRQRLGP